MFVHFVALDQPDHTMTKDTTFKLRISEADLAVIKGKAAAAGMSTAIAQEMVNELNQEKIKNGKNPINPIREYTFNRDGELIKRELHDVRELFPIAPMARSVQSLSYTTVKLRFLDFIMRKQEMDLEVNYNKNIR